MDRGTPGVHERGELEWQRIDPGDELLVGLKGFWCPRDAGPVSKGLDWSEIPGNYRLMVGLSHRMTPHVLERQDPPPDGAHNWTLRSNIVEISVKQPIGIDAEALRWAREQGHDPSSSVEVANRFPESRYAALLVWRMMTIAGTEPDQIKDAVEKGFYPGRYSVLDPLSPNGRRNVNRGAEMARWRIEQGERLLREQQDFPYERDIRLSVAVSYVVLGKKDKAMQLLKALRSEEGTLESQWAERFLSLQGWQSAD